MSHWALIYGAPRHGAAWFSVASPTSKSERAVNYVRHLRCESLRIAHAGGGGHTALLFRGDAEAIDAFVVDAVAEGW